MPCAHTEQYLEDKQNMAQPTEVGWRRLNFRPRFHCRIRPASGCLAFADDNCGGAIVRVTSFLSHLVVLLLPPPLGSLSQIEWAKV